MKESEKEFFSDKSSFVSSFSNHPRNVFCFA